MQTIVLNWDEEFRITEVANAETPEAAQAIIDAGEFRPEAFFFASDACWRDVQGWVADPGNQTANYMPPPPPVPAFVTPLQARKALRAAGLIGAVNAYVAAAGDEVQEEWDFALTIRRDNPTIAAAAASLGMTESQLDALFIAAAAI